MFKVLSRLVFLIMIFGVSACSVLSHKTDDERVLSLAGQRQVALLNQDFDKAYKYMSPGYRELRSIAYFTADHAGVYSWVSANAYKALCEENVCVVYVEIEYDSGILMGAAGKSSADAMLLSRVNKETWIKIDDKWWFSKSQ